MSVEERLKQLKEENERRRKKFEEMERAKKVTEELKAKEVLERRKQERVAEDQRMRQPWQQPEAPRKPILRAGQKKHKAASPGRPRDASPAGDQRRTEAERVRKEWRDGLRAHIEQCRADKPGSGQLTPGTSDQEASQSQQQQQPASASTTPVGLTWAELKVAAQAGFEQLLKQQEMQQWMAGEQGDHNNGRRNRNKSPYRGAVRPLPVADIQPIVLLPTIPSSAVRDLDGEYEADAKLNTAAQQVPVSNSVLAIGTEPQQPTTTPSNALAPPQQGDQVGSACQATGMGTSMLWTEGQDSGATVAESAACATDLASPGINRRELTTAVRYRQLPVRCSLDAGGNAMSIDGTPVPNHVAQQNNLTSHPIDGQDDVVTEPCAPQQSNEIKQASDAQSDMMAGASQIAPPPSGVMDTFRVETAVHRSMALLSRCEDHVQLCSPSSSTNPSPAKESPHPTPILPSTTTHAKSTQDASERGLTATQQPPARVASNVTNVTPAAFHCSTGHHNSEQQMSRDNYEQPCATPATRGGPALSLVVNTAGEHEESQPVLLSPSGRRPAVMISTPASPASPAAQRAAQLQHTRFEPTMPHFTQQKQHTQSDITHEDPEARNPVLQQPGQQTATDYTSTACNIQRPGQDVLSIQPHAAVHAVETSQPVDSATHSGTTGPVSQHHNQLQIQSGQSEAKTQSEQFETKCLHQHEGAVASQTGPPVQADDTTAVDAIDIPSTSSRAVTPLNVHGPDAAAEDVPAEEVAVDDDFGTLLAEIRNLSKLRKALKAEFEALGHEDAVQGLTSLATTMDTLALTGASFARAVSDDAAVQDTATSTLQQSGCYDTQTDNHGESMQIRRQEGVLENPAATLSVSERSSYHPVMQEHIVRATAAASQMYHSPAAHAQPVALSVPYAEQMQNSDQAQPALPLQPAPQPQHPVQMPSQSARPLLQWALPANTQLQPNIAHSQKQSHQAVSSTSGQDEPRTQLAQPIQPPASSQVVTVPEMRPAPASQQPSSSLTAGPGTHAVTTAGGLPVLQEHDNPLYGVADSAAQSPAGLQKTAMFVTQAQQQHQQVQQMSAEPSCGGHHRQGQGQGQHQQVPNIILYPPENSTASVASIESTKDTTGNALNATFGTQAHGMSSASDRDLDSEAPPPQQQQQQYHDVTFTSQQPHGAADHSPMLYARACSHAQKVHPTNGQATQQTMWAPHQAMQNEALPMPSTAAQGPAHAACQFVAMPAYGTELQQQQPFIAPATSATSGPVTGTQNTPNTAPTNTIIGHDVSFQPSLHSHMPFDRFLPANASPYQHGQYAVSSHQPFVHSLGQPQQSTPPSAPPCPPVDDTQALTQQLQWVIPAEVPGQPTGLQPQPPYQASAAPRTVSAGRSRPVTDTAQPQLIYNTPQSAAAVPGRSPHKTVASVTGPSSYASQLQTVANDSQAMQKPRAEVVAKPEVPPVERPQVLEGSYMQAAMEAKARAEREQQQRQAVSAATRRAAATQSPGALRRTLSDRGPNNATPGSILANVQVPITTTMNSHGASTAVKDHSMHKHTSPPRPLRAPANIGSYAQPAPPPSVVAAERQAKAAVAVARAVAAANMPASAPVSSVATPAYSAQGLPLSAPDTPGGSTMMLENNISIHQSQQHGVVNVKPSGNTKRAWASPAAVSPSGQSRIPRSIQGSRQATPPRRTTGTDQPHTLLPRSGTDQERSPDSGVDLDVVLEGMQDEDVEVDQGLYEFLEHASSSDNSPVQAAGNRLQEMRPGQLQLPPSGMSTPGGVTAQPREPQPAPSANANKQVVRQRGKEQSAVMNQQQRVGYASDMQQALSNPRGGSIASNSAATAATAPGTGYTSRRSPARTDGCNSTTSTAHATPALRSHMSTPSGSKPATPFTAAIKDLMGLPGAAPLQQARGVPAPRTAGAASQMTAEEAMLLASLQKLDKTILQKALATMEASENTTSVTSATTAAKVSAVMEQGKAVRAKATAAAKVSSGGRSKPGSVSGSKRQQASSEPDLTASQQSLLLRESLEKLDVRLDQLKSQVAGRAAACMATAITPRGNGGQRSLSPRAAGRAAGVGVATAAQHTGPGRPVPGNKVPTPNKLKALRDARQAQIIAAAGGGPNTATNRQASAGARMMEAAPAQHTQLLPPLPPRQASAPSMHNHMQQRNADLQAGVPYGIGPGNAPVQHAPHQAWAVQPHQGPHVTNGYHAQPVMHQHQRPMQAQPPAVQYAMHAVGNVGYQQHLLGPGDRVLYSTGSATHQHVQPSLPSMQDAQHGVQGAWIQQQPSVSHHEGQYLAHPPPPPQQQQQQSSFIGFASPGEGYMDSTATAFMGQPSQGYTVMRSRSSSSTGDRFSRVSNPGLEPHAAWMRSRDPALQQLGMHEDVHHAGVHANTHQPSQSHGIAHSDQNGSLYHSGQPPAAPYQQQNVTYMMPPHTQGSWRSQTAEPSHFSVGQQSQGVGSVRIPDRDHVAAGAAPHNGSYPAPIAMHNGNQAAGQLHRTSSASHTTQQNIHMQSGGAQAFRADQGVGVQYPQIMNGKALSAGVTGMPTSPKQDGVIKSYNLGVLLS